MVPICYNWFVKAARFFRALRTMRARHAVLLTPSKSSRPTQLLSCKQFAAVTYLESTLVEVLILKNFKFFRMNTYEKHWGGGRVLPRILTLYWKLRPNPGPSVIPTGVPAKSAGRSGGIAARSRRPLDRWERLKSNAYRPRMGIQIVTAPPARPSTASYGLPGHSGAPRHSRGPRHETSAHRILLQAVSPLPSAARES